MFKIGLTGGIGCGKTTTSKLFAAMDVPVIDADDIAHQLVEPGQPALVEIGKLFGEHILNPDGSLNRPQLRSIVFSDTAKKKKLETLLHPLVFASMQTKIDQLDNAYCIVSVPLLFETGMMHFVDRILVIDCPIDAQIERVRKRDGLVDTSIQSIINTQVSREFRIANADDLIDTSKNGNELAEQVKKLHNLYLSMSASLG